MGKVNRARLIVACDGTWTSKSQGPMSEPSNVINFSRALAAQDSSRRKETQIVYYQSGVGTNALGPIQHLIAGTTGKGLAENVLEAYLFLTDNFKRKDYIFLFGSSRGAYTVRSVAALIGFLGILTKEGLRHLTPIYILYQQADSPSSFDAAIKTYMANNHLEGMNWRVPPDEIQIKVIGVWDTVGSLGVPESDLVKSFHLNNKWTFLDIAMPSRVEYAFQALSLDEHRSTFYPTLWWKHPNAQFKKGKKTVIPELIQCWFPGHHGDVGGGSSDRKISNLSLAWMVDECSSRGLLDFDPEFIKEMCHPTGGYPYWARKMDPFYSIFLPSVLWKFLGSRLRTPGREPAPQQVEAGSLTYEYMHYSVREKMEEIAKYAAAECDSCRDGDIKPPSKALEGYVFDYEKKVWMLKSRPDLTIPELPPPSVDDKTSIQAWLSGDWLRRQGVGAVKSTIFTADDISTKYQ